MANKIYHVAVSHRGIVRIYSSTLNKLQSEVFGYSLECGNSWNAKIPLFPKTGKSLVKALNDSAYECHRYHDHYDLVTDEEFATAKTTNHWHGFGVAIEEIK